MFEVGNSISIGLTGGLRVTKKFPVGITDNHITKKVSIGYSTKLKVRKNFVAGLQNFDYDTLDMLGQI